MDIQDSEVQAPRDYPTALRATAATVLFFVVFFCIFVCFLGSVGEPEGMPGTPHGKTRPKK